MPSSSLAGRDCEWEQTYPNSFFLSVGNLSSCTRSVAFHAYDKDLKVILVLPKEQQTYWKELCEQYHFDEEYQLADGGASRFQSCKNGISMIPTDAVGLVGIHDGVRPFVLL